MSAWTKEREAFLREYYAGTTGDGADLLAALTDERARREAAEAAQAAVNEAARTRIARAEAERDTERARREAAERERDEARRDAESTRRVIEILGPERDEARARRAELAELARRLCDAVDRVPWGSIARGGGTSSIESAQGSSSRLRAALPDAPVRDARVMRAERAEAERDEARAALAVLREAARTVPFREDIRAALSAAAPIAGRYRASVLREIAGNYQIDDNQRAWLRALADAAEKGEKRS